MGVRQIGDTRKGRPYKGGQFKRVLSHRKIQIILSKLHKNIPFGFYGLAYFLVFFEILSYKSQMRVV